MTEKKQSLAIIGAGVTGLSAAWLLSDKYDVTLFEKNDYLGGHTHTHEIKEAEETLSIDSGFIVYNDKNYPNLIGLFKQLGIKTQATEMSFSFSMNKGSLEYAGTGFWGMFAQRSNILRIRHWKLLKEIVRFNKIAHAALNESEQLKSDSLSLGEFLHKHKISSDLQKHYLLPMGAAIWSCPMELMNQFPAYSFLRFFANHGLIDLKNRPQWRTVIGGSNSYVKEMMKTLSSKIKISGGATYVHREAGKSCVFNSVKKQYFDKVIFACHADEAIELLVSPTEDEIEILGCFQYQKNSTYLHTDKSVMPKRSSAWCSWNYLAETGAKKKPDEAKVTATYWMNKLQKLNANQDYFVTLNPFTEIDKEKIIKKMIYHHPVFSEAAITAQTKLAKLQGIQNTWFCGSYAGYGFHEDALASSVTVCESLGVTIPWKINK